MCVAFVIAAASYGDEVAQHRLHVEPGVPRVAVGGAVGAPAGEFEEDSGGVEFAVPVERSGLRTRRPLTFKST